MTRHEIPPRFATDLYDPDLLPKDDEPAAARRYLWTVLLDNDNIGSRVVTATHYDCGESDVTFYDGTTDDKVAMFPLTRILGVLRDAEVS